MKNEERCHRISIIVISDYKPGEEKSWADIRKTLRALKRQESKLVLEILLVESADIVGEIPPDVLRIIPTLKVVSSQAGNSYAMANEGVQMASGDWVVLLDADCVPCEQWLSSIVEVTENEPDAAVVSGRTIYPGDSFLERALALLMRSYVDAGEYGRTTHISNNNAAYRKHAYLRFPLPENAGVYASPLQSFPMVEHGEKLLFHPGMTVIHDFEGWEMERDARRYMGYGRVITRKQNSRLPMAWVVNAGVLSVPILYLGGVLSEMAYSIRVFRAYGIKFWELPCVVVLSLYVHLLETPGMIAALRNGPPPHSVYR